jgi:hypothetical protein
MLPSFAPDFPLPFPDLFAAAGRLRAADSSAALSPGLDSPPPAAAAAILLATLFVEVEELLPRERELRPPRRPPLPPPLPLLLPVVFC